MCLWYNYRYAFKEPTRQLFLKFKIVPIVVSCRQQRSKEATDLQTVGKSGNLAGWYLYFRSGNFFTNKQPFRYVNHLGTQYGNEKNGTRIFRGQIL